MEQGQIKYWLALNTVYGLGIAGQKALIHAFASPEKIFAASLNDLCSITGIGKTLAQRIHCFQDWSKIEKELDIYHLENITVLCWQSSPYPPLLSHIYDPPPLLFVKGRMCLSDPCVAVVGSRMAGPYGIMTTERLCRELAFRGVTVVSGMARGIDAAAHRGAIAGKGKTIAVLGNGLDTVYPPENLKLSAEIAECGALVTEYRVGIPPHPSHFPARNRIISGLCRGVLVVEAGEKSGSLITAKLALEQGREVFAIPGSIDSPGSKGTHKLLKEGAKLVESVDDIIDEIAFGTVNPTPVFLSEKASMLDQNAGKSPTVPSDKATLTREEQSVLSLFRNLPRAVDELIDQTGFSCQAVQQILMMLEIKGYLNKIAGSKYTVKE